jgi:glycerol kinase
MNTKILTIDQGTTSSRAVIFGENMEVLDQSQQEYPLIYPADGWVEIDPNVLLNSVIETLSAFKDEHIENVAITNQRETTLVWDKKTGNPIYNAIVWQDRRTSDYCESIKTKDVQSLVQKKTGLILDPYFSATKIKWILDNVEGAREKAVNGDLCFGTVDTFLMYKLSNGKIFKTDYTNASRTMLFNIHTLSWDQDLLKLFDIPESLLPEPVACDSKFGNIEFANNPEINAVLGDQHAALFGQNCLNRGQMKSTYGTGCFLMVNTGLKPINSQDGLLTTLAFHWQNNCHYALEGSIYSAGTIVQWLRDGLMLFKESKDCENFLDENFFTNNLIFIPAFNGLGTPFWNSEIRSSFHGITRDTTKINLVTAALASVSYQTNEIVSCLSNIGIEVDELKIDGGMTVNKWFRRHLATTLNKNIMTPDNPESTALGVAIMSLINASIVDNEIFKTLNFSMTTPTKSLVGDVQNDNNKWRNYIEKEIKSIS